jgi:hypothetical protein
MKTPSVPGWLVSRKFRYAGPLETAAVMIAWRCVGCTENEGVAGRMEGAGTGAAAELRASSQLGVGLKEGLAVGVLIMLDAGLLCEQPALRDETLACMVEGCKCTDDLQVRGGARCVRQGQLATREGSWQAVARSDWKRAESEMSDFQVTSNPGHINCRFAQTLHC